MKASGLAAGKGVVVANTRDEACAAADEILGDKKYGSAGNRIVVEEKLSGEEISVIIPIMFLLLCSPILNNCFPIVSIYFPINLTHEAPNEAHNLYALLDVCSTIIDFVCLADFMCVCVANFSCFIPPVGRLIVLSTEPYNNSRQKLHALIDFISFVVMFYQLLAFVDGESVQVMLPSQDHKRLLNNDEGPNTGGMGAYCPCPLITADDLAFARREIIEKAVAGFNELGIKYCGVLYAGLMLTPNGPRTLEFNCRFGDPETQVVLPLLETDLYEIADACCMGRLKDIKLQWKQQKAAVGVVMASENYPDKPINGRSISGMRVDTLCCLVKWI